MRSAVAHISNLTPNGLVAKAVFIYSKMNGNPLFTTPIPALLLLDAARKALEDAIAAATDGGHSAHVDVRIKASQLAVIIIELSNYVTFIANENESIILSAGFDVRKKRTLIGELPAPIGLVVKTSLDVPGRLTMRWNPVEGAYMYQIFMSTGDPNDEKTWTMVDVSSRASFTKDGLEAGSTYWFRVNCMGAAGISPMSDPAKGVVL